MLVTIKNPKNVLSPNPQIKIHKIYFIVIILKITNDPKIFFKIAKISQILLKFWKKTTDSCKFLKKLPLTVNSFTNNRIFFINFIKSLQNKFSCHSRCIVMKFLSEFSNRFKNFPIVPLFLLQNWEPEFWGVLGTLVSTGSFADLVTQKDCPDPYPDSGSTTLAACMMRCTWNSAVLEYAENSWTFDGSEDCRRGHGRK